MIARKKKKALIVCGIIIVAIALTMIIRVKKEVNYIDMDYRPFQVGVSAGETEFDYTIHDIVLNIHVKMTQGTMGVKLIDEHDKVIYEKVFEGEVDETVTVKVGDAKLLKDETETQGVEGNITIKGVGKIPLIFKLLNL